MPTTKQPTPREMLHIRISEAERAAIQAAADREMITLSAWARRALILAASEKKSSKGGK